MQMRYNKLICPLTTLYGNLRNQSTFDVSYMTLYDFKEIFSTSKMQNMQFLGIEFFV